MSSASMMHVPWLFGALGFLLRAQECCKQSEDNLVMMEEEEEAGGESGVGGLVVCLENESAQMRMVWLDETASS